MLNYSQEIEFKILQQALKDIKKLLNKYRQDDLSIADLVDSLEDIFVYDLSDTLVE